MKTQKRASSWPKPSETTFDDYKSWINAASKAAAREKEFTLWRSELNALISHACSSRNASAHDLTDGRLGKFLRFFTQQTTLSRRLNEPEQGMFAFLPGVIPIPFPPPRNPQFKFIDLFAGIGGFRLALQGCGGECVFSCEWDTAAKQTYFANFGEYPFGDIRQFTNPSLNDSEIDALIPDHDVLAAGFPCQPFSHAGVSARQSLGKKHGFECNTQGTLFFDLVRVAKVKRPRVLLLENVKNLQSHDKGRTFATIRQTIEEELGYSFSSTIIDASTLVPQRRKRCFMVCFRERSRDFVFPQISGPPLALRTVLEDEVSDWFTLSDRMWQGHIKRTERNLARGTGFTAFVADLDRPANTLVSRYWKDGKECLVPQEGKNPRFLTPRECARLQGFPEEFRLPQSANSAYRQFGNSVAVPVVKLVASAVVEQGLRSQRAA